MNNQAVEPDVDPVGPDGVTDLEAYVQFRLGTLIRDFRLVAKDAGLVLHGQARNFYCKQLAQHALMQATDRPILANQIKVP